MYNTCIYGAALLIEKQHLLSWFGSCCPVIPTVAAISNLLSSKTNIKKSCVKLHFIWQEDRCNLTTLLVIGCTALFKAIVAYSCAVTPYKDKPWLSLFDS